MKRLFLSLAAVALVASVAAANPPALRLNVGHCAPAAVYAPPAVVVQRQYVQPACAVQVQQYAAPVVQPVCAAPVYAPAVQVQAYAAPVAVQSYYAPALRLQASYGYSNVLAVQHSQRVLFSRRSALRVRTGGVAVVGAPGTVVNVNQRRGLFGGGGLFGKRNNAVQVQVR